MAAAAILDVSKIQKNLTVDLLQGANMRRRAKFLSK